MCVRVCARAHVTVCACCEQFERRSGKATETTVPWLVYTTFHAGEYKRAAELVEEMLATDDADPNLHTFLAACYFYLGMFKEAEQEALKGTRTTCMRACVRACARSHGAARCGAAPSSRLQVRILFQVSHRLNDENKLVCECGAHRAAVSRVPHGRAQMSYHQRLQDCTEDQLTLAAIHCLRGHFQEAADVYRRLLSENRDFLALNVYLALCYYRLDFNDAAIEVLQAYLQRYPTSLMALNLKVRACLSGAVRARASRWASQQWHSPLRSATASARRTRHARDTFMRAPDTQTRTCARLGV